MKAHRAVFPQPNQCRIVPFDLPDEPAADQVLIETQLSLISPGTETVIFTGKHSNFHGGTAPWPRFPFYPGYSCVGRILKTGVEVQDYHPGDRVFVPGTHASHHVTSTAGLVRVPEEVPAESAAFAELATIAMNGVQMAQIRLGESVLVVGLGIVGILASRFAKLSGALPLLAADLSAARRQLAPLFGVDHVINPQTEQIGDRLRMLPGGRADVVIEATGVSRVVSECLGWTRNGGRVILLGSPHGKVEIDFYTDVHARNLQIIGAHISAANSPFLSPVPWTKERNRAIFMELVRRGELPLQSLIRERITPDELEETYLELAKVSEAPAGIVIDWMK